MRQLSGEFNHSAPDVRTKCVLTKLYKANKRLDQRGDFGIRKRGDRKELAIVPFSSDKTWGQTLSQFSIY